ncbi:MAG TPA: hypothetical protein VJJ26_01845 [Candidatus Babeliales bacterium]|nr:hypothetical protein [Candidatus Babeliales bacterium]
MKSRFFPKRDEVVLSAMTAVVVVGLLQLGFAALSDNRTHEMFRSSVVISKK